MIKLVFCLRRKEGMTLEAFQRYWYDKHGPLVRKHGEALRIRRYVQLHTRDTAMSASLREGRGSPEGYDGVAELWWDSVEDLQDAFETPEGQAAGAELLEDERKFIDLSQSPLWIADERPVIDPDS